MNNDSLFLMHTVTNKLFCAWFDIDRDGLGWIPNQSMFMLAFDIS